MATEGVICQVPTSHGVGFDLDQGFESLGFFRASELKSDLRFRAQIRIIRDVCIAWLSKKLKQVTKVWASSRQGGFLLKVNCKRSLTAIQYRVASAAPTRYSGVV